MEYVKAKLEGIIRLNGDVNWKGSITSCTAPNVLQVSVGPTGSVIRLLLLSPLNYVQVIENGSLLGTPTTRTFW